MHFLLSKPKRLTEAESQVTSNFYQATSGFPVFCIHELYSMCHIIPIPVYVSPVHACGLINRKYLACTTARIDASIIGPLAQKRTTIHIIVPLIKLQNIHCIADVADIFPQNNQIHIFQGPVSSILTIQAQNRRNPFTRSDALPR